jgi:hypothetical protein
MDDQAKKTQKDQEAQDEINKVLASLTPDDSSQSQDNADQKQTDQEEQTSASEKKEINLADTQETEPEADSDQDLDTISKDKAASLPQAEQEENTDQPLTKAENQPKKDKEELETEAKPQTKEKTDQDPDLPESSPEQKDNESNSAIKPQSKTEAISEKEPPKPEQPKESESEESEETETGEAESVEELAKKIFPEKKHDREIKAQEEKRKKLEKEKEKLKNKQQKAEKKKKASGKENKFAGPFNLIGKALKTFFNNFGVILGIYLLAFGLQFAFSALSLGTVFISLFNQGLDTLQLQNIIILIVSLVGFGLAMGIIHGLNQIAVMLFVKHENKKLGVFEAYSRAINKFLPYLLTMALSMLIIWGGTIFFVIPGILFCIWILLAPMVVIFDNQSGFQALLKSREYIKNRFLGIIWRYICFFLVIGGLGGLFGVLTNQISAMINSQQNLVYAVVTNFVSILLTPFMFVYSSHVFMALKQSKTEKEVDIEGKSKTVYILFAVIGFLVLLAIPILGAFFYNSQIITSGGVN